MYKSLLFLISILSFSHQIFAQDNAKYDYHPPLKIPLILSANFGELRPNHFHMGVDFKTNGREGYNIYAIEEGFVSRIKVSTFGYGKVIYIDHPNGVTSVYAHCSEFKGEIDSIVRIIQEKEQNFEVEIFPKKNEIKVTKGQIISISGNSGGSTAPHLHFEIRDTKTEHALNPLLYGFSMPDTKAPEIRGVKLYSLTKEGYRYPDKALKKNVEKGANGYYIGENKLVVPASYLTPTGGLGLAFDVIDRLDGASNQCGLFGALLIINNDTIFGQRTERIPFESTRFVNCHKDYEEYAANRKKFHKSFRTQENDLPIYTNNELGVFSAKPGDELNVRYVVFDPNGNTSELKFTIVVSAGTVNSKDMIYSLSESLQPMETKRVTGKTTTVDFGITTVYEPMKINAATIDRTIGDAQTPVNKAYLIKIKSNVEKDGKHYLEMITAKGKKKELELTFDDSTFYCTSKFFGSYSIQRDETGPSVVPYGFSSSTTVTSASTLKWKISDSQIGITDYDLFIDGEWKLLDYDYKSGLITYSRDASVVGTKELLLLVKDGCGNVTEWKSNLEFK